MAESARGILAAMKTKDLDRLEQELARASSLERCLEPATPPAEAERIELLGAVAGHLRESVGRLGRGSTSRLDGAEVDLALLKHLARLPAA